MGRVEVITGVERRRRWSEEQKRALVAAAFAPGAVVSDVARRADLRPGQLYRWRRELRPVADGFAGVIVAPPVPAVFDPAAPAIEVAFGDNGQVRIPLATPPGLAAAVLKTLAGR